MRNGAHEACLRDSREGRCAFMPVRGVQIGVSREAPVASLQARAVRRLGRDDAPMSKYAKA